MKRYRKVGLLVFILALMASVIGAASAQEGRRGGLRGHQRLDFGGDIMALLSEATGLERQDILTQLREGATLAEIITANGGDVAAVQEEVIALATERINAAVADGRLSQARADSLLENLETRVNAALNGELPLLNRFGRGGDDGRYVGWHLLRAVAEAAGLDRQEMLEQMSAGKTPSEILTENGVDAEAFVNEQLSQLETRLANAVSNGRLTQEEADARLAEATEKLNAWMNEPLSAPQNPIIFTPAGV